VLVVHKSRRFSRRGDPNTRCLHRRHTCTSNCHASIFLLKNLSVSLTTYKSKISIRTSSGSLSIGMTWPTSYQVSSVQQVLLKIMHEKDVYRLCLTISGPSDLQTVVYQDMVIRGASSTMGMLEPTSSSYQRMRSRENQSGEDSTLLLP